MQPLLIAQLLLQLGLGRLQGEVQLFALGDIHRRAARTLDLSAGIGLESNPMEEPAYVPIGTDDALFPLVRHFTAPDMLVHCMPALLNMAGAQAIQPQIQGNWPLLSGLSKYLTQTR